jgi:hypothetical protein
MTGTLHKTEEEIETLAKKYVGMFDNNPKECAITHIDETIKHMREIESILKLSGIITLIIDSKISHLNKIKKVLNS